MNAPVLERLLGAIGQGARLSGKYVDNTVSARKIAESIKNEISANDEQQALLSWFIHLADLSAVTPVRLQELVEDSPWSTGDPHWDALIAALAEYVRQQKGVQPPEWV